jgi:predicted amidohydrolase YtcJ
MAIAVTRQLPGQPPITPAQRISIQNAIDAYTISGARYLNRDRDAGSIEVGKSADFIVVDRDILKLAAAGQGRDIAHTKGARDLVQGRERLQAAGKSKRKFRRPVIFLERPLKEVLSFRQ